MSLLMTDALAVSPTQRQRVSRASHRTRRQAGLTLDDLGADLISYAMSQWPAATVANAAASCRTLYGLLDLAVQLACAQMGRALPPRRNQYDSLTCRLHFVQHSVLRAAKTLSASTSKSVCLVNDSAVLSWGSAGVYEEITTLLPTRVPFSVATPVREVAAGESHCLLLSHGGSVFSWGENNAHGQLGQGDTLPQREPRRVRALDGLHVMQVACGKEHSLVLTTGGDAYSFGNGTLGRLGLGVAVDAWTPQRICAAGKRGTPSFARENAHVSEVVAARLADVEPLPRLVMVAAGLFHSLGTAADGSVYSWGSGTNGRLGHGDTVMQLRPHRIATLRDVVYVAAGSGHSLAIDSKGRLYTWGQGYNGRLGHGERCPSTRLLALGMRAAAIELTHAPAAHSVRVAAHPRPPTASTLRSQVIRRRSRSRASSRASSASTSSRRRRAPSLPSR